MKKLLLMAGLILLVSAMVFAGGSSEKATKESNVNVTPTLNEDGTFHLPIVDSKKEFTIFLNFNNMPFDNNWKVGKSWKRELM